MKEKIILATGNQGKVKELERLLQGLSVEVLSLKDFDEEIEIIENGKTFSANAIIKAEIVLKAIGEKAIVLADDSGLEVDYLGGAPSIYSARFAGEDASDEDNNKKLITLLQGVPQEERKARFCCAIAIAKSGIKTKVIEGYCLGTIITSPRGEDGFGYDPLFQVEGMDKTFAELDHETKNRISHRGKALAKAVPLIKELL